MIAYFLSILCFRRANHRRFVVIARNLFYEFGPIKCNYFIVPAVANADTVFNWRCPSTLLRNPFQAKTYSFAV